MERGLTTRAATREIRLRQWQEIFHDRKESGLTVKEYCQRHGLTKDRYYYWQKVAREAVIAASGPVFAELKSEMYDQAGEFMPELTIRIGTAVIYANRDTPEGLLQRTIRAAKYVE